MQKDESFNAKARIKTVEVNRFANFSVKEKITRLMKWGRFARKVFEAHKLTFFGEKLYVRFAHETLKMPIYFAIESHLSEA